jgi:hypothetical protein
MKNTIKAFACGTVATLAVIGLSQTVQGQNITETQSSTVSSWAGTPVYQTGATPEGGSGGTTQDNDGWGQSGSGTGGNGSLGQAFEVTSPGVLTSVQMIMAGTIGTFNVELYDLGSASSLGFPPTYGATTPTPITQINYPIGPNLLQAGDSFTPAGGWASQELVTLTFGGADANVSLVTGEVYMLAIDPTFSAGSTWWDRGGNPVAAYDTGEGMNTDSASYAEAYQDFESKGTIRDFDTAVDVSAVPEPSTIALGVMGACSFLLRRRSK